MGLIELHIPTLAVVAVFVTAILGTLLLLSWRRDRSTDALAWWGGGYLLAGAAFGLLSARGHIADVLSVEMANTVLLLGYGLIFAGMRAFGRRETPVTVFLIAPLIWLIAMRVPMIAADINLRVVVVSSLQGSLVILMAHELWRQRGEPLRSRWPAIVVMLVHAAMLSLRIIAVTVSPAVSHADFFHSSSFALLAFGTVLYTITFAFLLLSMTKERTELIHKTASLVDPLTGLANRRAFLHDAEMLIAARASRSEPLAVLVADLDHFKTINDRFGHAIGDEVLRVFATVLRRSIRTEGFAGRLGGEEFAILLPGAREDAARGLGETIRDAFAEAAMEIEGHPVAGTVSIGVASLRIGTHDLIGVLNRADSALYQAKEQGRDRVVVFGEGTPSGGEGITCGEIPLVPDVEPIEAPVRA